MTAGPVCDHVTRVSDGWREVAAAFPAACALPWTAQPVHPVLSAGARGHGESQRPPADGQRTQRHSVWPLFCLKGPVLQLRHTGRGKRCRGTMVPFPWDQLLQNKGNTFAIKALTTLVQKRVLPRSQRPRGTATSRDSQRTMDSCSEGMHKHPNYHEKREREETRRKPPPSHI